MRKLQWTVAVLTLCTFLQAALAGDLGDAEAAYGRGDYATAYRLFRSLAEQSDAEAQFYLGLMYYHGEGVAQDYKEAMKWYGKAAEQGDAEAQYILGAMYYLGEGVAQDYVKAHMWLNISSANGYDDGRKPRDFVAKQMTPAQIAEAQRLAQEWMAKHAIWWPTI